MLWSKLALKQKLIVAIGGALFISITVSTLFTNYLMRDATVERISTTEIPAILSSVAAQIEDPIATPLNAAKAMAYSTFVRDWLAGGEDQSQLPRYIDHLKQFKSLTQSSSAFLISVASGRYYTQDGLRNTLSRDNPGDSWFYGFLDSGETVSLDIDSDISTGSLMLYINYLTPDKQALTGIGLSVNELSQLVKSYRIGNNGRVYLVDAQGQVRVHSDSQLTGKASLADFDYIGAQAGVLLDKGETQILNVSGERDLMIASRYIESLGWFLIAEIPHDEIFSGVERTTLYVVAVNIVLALVFIILSVFLAASIARPIQRTAAMLGDIADGDADLTQQLSVDSDDEIGQLADAFNRFIANMRQLIQELSDTAKSIEQTSTVISTSADDTRGNSSQQVQSIEMVAAAINEMGATVEEISNNATETADTSSQSSEEANASQTVVVDTVAEIETLSADLESAAVVIERLATDVAQINSVLAVISGISEQTNLLALNAAIEAARAGEQGRGFAVVADEVRMLAQRTQESTKEINLMVAKLEGGASDAVQAMGVGRERCQNVVAGAAKTNQSLDSILAAIESISNMSFQVATATKEQNTVVADLNQHVSNINELAELTAQVSRETADASQSLNNNVSGLSRIVGNFKY